MNDRDKSVAFNLKQAANYLGISRPTLLEILRSGEIPSRKIGNRRWLISKAVLDKWVQQSDRAGGMQVGK